MEAGFSALTGQQLWIHNVTIPMYHYDQVLTAGQDVLRLRRQRRNHGIRLLYDKQIAAVGTNTNFLTTP